MSIASIQVCLNVFKNVGYYAVLDLPCLSRVSTKGSLHDVGHLEAPHYEAVAFWPVHLHDLTALDCMVYSKNNSVYTAKPGSGPVKLLRGLASSVSLIGFALYP